MATWFYAHVNVVISGAEEIGREAPKSSVESISSQEEAGGAAAEETVACRVRPSSPTTPTQR